MMRFFNALVIALFFPLAAVLSAEELSLGFSGVDTSRVMGSPDPLPPLEYERAFPKLRIARPVQPTHAGDGTNRVFVVTQDGMIHTFPNDASVKSSKVFLDIRDRVINPGGDNGMFAVAFHPSYRDNGQLYVVYGTRAKPKATVVSRFKVSAADPNYVDQDSEEILFHIKQPWPDHNAACLAFGPDGYLYISLGDGGYSLENTNAQNLSTLLGSMLRIDVDRRDVGLNYAVPANNPFVGLESARKEIWAYGLRAPWRFSFDRVTGDCWLGDNGQVEFEEINLIKPGENYGWMPREGTHAFDPNSIDQRGRPAQKKQAQRAPEFNRNDKYADPVLEYDHSQGKSVVGGIVYRGQQFPEMIGAYIYGDYANGNIWALRWDGKKVIENKLIARTRLKISSFGEDEQGELCFSAMDGYIYRLRPAKPTGIKQVFPTLLSETGLFESTADHKPAVGIIPYSVNMPLWTDGAHKQRFLALPRSNSVGFRVTEAWDYPVGTVFLKTFSLDLIQGNPESRRRLETRLLVLNQRGWVGYTYRWNDEQTDAFLLGGAITETLEIQAGDQKIQQSWYYPSRSDCMTCHTREAGFTLGGNTLQLNRQHTYFNQSANQLTAFAAAGVFKQPLPQDHAALPAWPDWDARTGTLSERARAYLAVNCSTCHTPPGYTKLDLRWNTPLGQSQAVDQNPEKPRVGPFDSKVIWSGKPDHSEIYLRMIHQGPGRMPNVGSSEIHHEGAELIKLWIESLEE